MALKFGVTDTVVTESSSLPIIFTLFHSNPFRVPMSHSYRTRGAGTVGGEGVTRLPSIRRTVGDKQLPF